jgi:hypothetical protein
LMIVDESHSRAVRRRFERDAQGIDAIYRLERSPFWRWVNTRLRKAVFERHTINFNRLGTLRGQEDPRRWMRVRCVFGRLRAA